MKTFYSLTLSVLVICLYVSSLNAQINPDLTKERYIQIKNTSDFFTHSENDSNIVICSFELINIFENESSKAIFVDVNEISNVVKFNIKSGSERYENQRSCYLKMNDTKHLLTFRLVMDRIKVNYILYDERFISVSDFLSKTF